MKEIWSTRLSKYQQKLLKYLRFVFNDHFIIALFFIFGALCYGYVVLLDRYVVKGTALDMFLMIVLLYGFLHIGKFATLVEQPDIIFLLPKDFQMNEYLNNALHHCFGINGLIQSVLTITVVPFLVRALGFNGIGWIMLLIGQIFYKFVLLIIDKISLFNIEWKNSIIGRIVYWGIPLIGIGLGIAINPLFSLLIALLMWGTLFNLQSKLQGKHLFRWKNAIQIEEQRLTRIYKFFSLFTDVPEVQQTVKRRKYLERFLPKYNEDSSQTYNYLFWRAFCRSTEYFNLFVRLTVIAVLVIYFVHIKWLMLVIGGLFVYLTGFQLLPLYHQFDDLVFTHLYPIAIKDKISSFKKILQRILMIEIGLIAISMLIASHSFILAILFIVIGIGLIILLQQMLKQRLVKMA